MKNFGSMMASSLAALAVSSPSIANAGTTTAREFICMESNSCKTKGHCAGVSGVDENTCNGLNSCKNHLLSKAKQDDCKKVGGTWTKIPK